VSVRWAGSQGNAERGANPRERARLLPGMAPGPASSPLLLNRQGAKAPQSPERKRGETLPNPQSALPNPQSAINFAPWAARRAVRFDARCDMDRGRSSSRRRAAAFSIVNRQSSRVGWASRPSINEPRTAGGASRMTSCSAGCRSRPSASIRKAIVRRLARLLQSAAGFLRGGTKARRHGGTKARRHGGTEGIGPKQSAFRTPHSAFDDLPPVILGPGGDYITVWPDIRKGDS
jgi:hypothetical protein